MSYCIMSTAAGAGVYLAETPPIDFKKYESLKQSYLDYFGKVCASDAVLFDTKERAEMALKRLILMGKGTQWFLRKYDACMNNVLPAEL